MNGPTKTNVALIVIGMVAWTPVIISMMNGANLRPMLHVLFFVVMLFMTPISLFSTAKTWNENNHPWSNSAIQVTILFGALLATVGPFFVMPLMGYHFGK